MLGGVSAPHDPLQLAVELDLFQGPFDLLLTLLLREEVDLFELPLADLVVCALGEDALERWDLPTAGELIVILAALAELKARLLLGEALDDEPDPDALEARERLVSRLVAYAPYQRAGIWLGQRFDAHAGPRYRRVHLEAVGAPPPPQEDPARLAARLTLLLTSVPAPSLDHLTSREVNMPALLQRLREALVAGSALSFDDVVRGQSRLEEAMTLIAILELARRGEATLDQPAAFGDISVIPTRVPA